MPIFIKNKGSNTYDVAIVSNNAVLILDTNLDLKSNSEVIEEIISTSIENQSNN